MLQVVISQRQSSPIVPNNEIVQRPPVVETPNVSVAYYINDTEIPTSSATMSSQLFQKGFGSSPGESIVGDQLYKDLDTARKPGLQAHTYYIPSSDLRRLITVPKIKQIILHGHPDMKAAEARIYAEKTETYARKLFANLALQQKGATICSLLDSGISDQSLPFQRKRKSGGQWSLWLMKPKELIQAFEQWDSRSIEDFERTQWWMMAPIFDKHCRDCQELEDLTILPFSPINGYSNEDEEEDEEDIGEADGENDGQNDIGNDGRMDTGIPHMKSGGYSEVNAYYAHPAHHNFCDSSNPLVRSLTISLRSFTNNMQKRQCFVADKKLMADDEAAFLKEKSILDLLGPMEHKHLIPLLSSYRKKKHYHLLFPCADCNLRVYWAKNPFPIFGKNTVLRSIRQMSGITSALALIHNIRVKFDLDVDGGVRLQEGGAKLSIKAGEEKYGRHGDIKPENILWFKEEEVLKITDFGLGRFHGRDSRSGIDPRKISGTLTYEPPECSLARPVSRKYDIWSLGCLFLEFATWLLEGAAKIDDFANERGLNTGIINDDTFFTVFSDSNHEKYANVREGVVRWVDGLHAHRKCTQAIHELLDLVMGSMLKSRP